MDLQQGEELHARVVSTASELEALRPEWAALHAACHASAFLSYEWNRAWWRHFGEPNPRLRLHILVLERAGRTVAIAPLTIETIRVLGVAPLRQVSLLGRGVADYGDVLV